VFGSFLSATVFTPSTSCCSPEIGVGLSGKDLPPSVERSHTVCCLIAAEMFWPQQATMIPVLPSLSGPALFTAKVFLSSRKPSGLEPLSVAPVLPFSSG
jgi:hypothetical protein